MVPAAEVRRLFGQPGGGNHDTWQAVASVAQPFDFETTPKVKPRGHVVAVRITSEDPEDGFKPTSGRIQELSLRGGRTCGPTSQSRWGLNFCGLSAFRVAVRQMGGCGSWNLKERATPSNWGSDSRAFEGLAVTARELEALKLSESQVRGLRPLQLRSSQR